MAAIIFDFDGTIADSFETVIHIFHELTGRGEPLTPKEVERLRGMSLLRAAEELHVRPWKMPFLLMRGRRRMRKQIGQLHTFPDMPNVIKKLHHEGHQLFIMSSNSESNIKLFLKQHHLSKEFIQIYGNVGLLGKARKLRKVIKQNQLDQATTWYVGDEVRDIVGSQQAGLRIAAVGWGYNTVDILRQHNPTRLLATPDELLLLLEEI
ncbi:MAG: haloacid dehalogenase superfamily enzyme subfamily [Candidatus Saccharibacteria bacterium]|nr:haloacid dehalogenase superfamily enzyme subfamily [Candidatus Saccharibacteria bacterium]